MKKLLAKSVNNQGVKTGRTLVEHIEDLLAVYQVIIEPLSISDRRKKAIFLACVTHDLGKINSKFQQRLIANIETSEKVKFNSQEEVNHNLLSPAFLKVILEKYPLDGLSKEVVMKAVMYHHGSFTRYQNLQFSRIEEAIHFDILRDIINSQNYDLSDINELIKKYLKIDYMFREKDISYDYSDEFNESFSESDQNVYQDYIEVKGFLNLIDHIASNLEGEVPNYFLDKKSQDDLDEALLSYLKKSSNDPTAKFNQIQETVVRHKKANLLITEAFTSAGKTIADDRLVAAKKFYLTPNRISAMSFYQEACQKYSKENVGVLHGAIHLYKDAEQESDNNLIISQDEIDLARNYAKPYILATVDQIALAIFKFPNYEKTLVALKEARVCVDEVHLLSPRMFTAFLLLMEYSMIHLGTRYHLMTATLPLSYQEKLSELSDRQPQLLVGNNVSLVSEEGKQIRLLQRTGVSEITSICRDAIESKQQVLIVLNKVDDVINTYQDLQKEFNDKEIIIKCLHSRFKEGELKTLYQEMAEQKGTIWVTTQVVEIALDIDFPIVISDLAPMDSLIQRMGRNNRKGRLKEGGKFYLLEKRSKSVYSDILLEETADILKKALKEQKSKKELKLTLVARKRLLEDYYNTKKVTKFYEDEFKQSKRALQGIFGVTSYTELTGESIMFDQEPYKNLADNKKEASKYFRDAGMRVKVYLESDIVAETSLTGKAITISSGKLYQLKQNRTIYEKANGHGGHLFVIKDSDGFANYNSIRGLVFD